MGGVPHLICTGSKENVSLLSKARARSWRVLPWDQRADNQKVSHPLVGDRQFWNTTRTVPDRRIYFTLSMSLLGAVFTGSSLGALRALRHPYEPRQIACVLFSSFCPSWKNKQRDTNWMTEVGEKEKFRNSRLAWAGQEMCIQADGIYILWPHPQETERREKQGWICPLRDDNDGRFLKSHTSLNHQPDRKAQCHLISFAGFWNVWGGEKDTPLPQFGFVDRRPWWRRAGTTSPQVPTLFPCIFPGNHLSR